MAREMPPNVKSVGLESHGECFPDVVDMVKLVTVMTLLMLVCRISEYFPCTAYMYVYFCFIYL